MEWIANPSVGDWLREQVDEDYSTMHGVVPRGYPSYVRIFHPATVRSLPDRPVPTYAEWEKIAPEKQARLVELFTDEPATWSQTAEAFGTQLHPLAQWQRIVRTPAEEDWNARVAPDGREFTAPVDGQLDIDALAALAAHLVAHTRTPDAGCAALWEGTGGLVGYLGQTPSRTFFTIGGDPNHEAMLGRSTHDPFNNVFRKPTWQDGILSREISEGARLQLPGRDHVLFSVPPRAFTDQTWVLDAPWRDRIAEQHGFPPAALSPSIIWPEDRVWVVVSEVDFDSTVVAGSAELIQAICADQRLEALPLTEGADLGWHGDEVNG